MLHRLLGLIVSFAFRLSACITTDSNPPVDLLLHLKLTEKNECQLIPDSMNPRQLSFLRGLVSGSEEETLSLKPYCHLLSEYVPWATSQATVKARGKHTLLTSQ